MTDRTRTIHGVTVPAFLYGTAWKEDATAGLVTQALRAGFRGIDTANQRRHYHEAAVGQALADAFQQGPLKRDDLFLQTKFTYTMGQDHRLPYDPDAPVAEQVKQSFRSSLEHLGVDQLDSYLLHGPSRRDTLGPDDWEVWRTMEQLHEAGHTRLIGVSNVSPAQLDELCRSARTPPAFVQNRCFAKLGWDADVRTLCDQHGIAYQGFSLLTGNRGILQHPDIEAIAGKHNRTPAQIVFGFSLHLGMIPLTGTTDPNHMAQDLDAFDIDLTAEETRTIERIAA